MFGKKEQNSKMKSKNFRNWRCAKFPAGNNQTSMETGYGRLVAGDRGSAESYHYKVSTFFSADLYHVRV